MNGSNPPYVYKHIVVVHGIGNQRPNETALGFMNEFMRALAEYGEIDVDNLIASVDDFKQPPVPGARDQTFQPAFLIFRSNAVQRRFVIGFSEVYWQHITGKYLARYGGDPPIPVFTWAHSVSTRFLKTGWKYHVAREALENLEKMLDLLKLLAVVFKRGGQLAAILNRFLGDVQMYAESDAIREEINARFREVLNKTHKIAAETRKKISGATFSSPDPEIYVVAHSEGTVVSYNSLIEATLAGDAWVRDVRALVTLGSPLDKHYNIWPNRFATDVLTAAPTREKKIRWFNFWDQNDPVGYGLKDLFPEAKPNCDARKLFQPCYDQGFLRYPIPGLAHVGYWTDRGVHRQIIAQVMELAEVKKEDSTVSSRPWGHPWVLLAGAGLGHAVVRLLTLAWGFYSFNRFLTLARPWAFHLKTVTVWVDSHPWDNPPLNYLFWVLLPLVAGLFLWRIFMSVRGVPAQLVFWTRRLLLLAWGIGVVLFSVGLLKPCPQAGCEPPLITDLIGYAGGVVVAVLVWRLHTTVHRGLIQMWRYTMGGDTRLEL